MDGLACHLWLLDRYIPVSLLTATHQPSHHVHGKPNVTFEIKLLALPCLLDQIQANRDCPNLDNVHWRSKQKIK